jgi:hypothetical protein
LVNAGPLIGESGPEIIEKNTVALGSRLPFVSVAVTVIVAGVPTGAEVVVVESVRVFSVGGVESGGARATICVTGLLFTSVNRFGPGASVLAKLTVAGPPPIVPSGA